MQEGDQLYHIYSAVECFKRIFVLEFEDIGYDEEFYVIHVYCFLQV